VAAAIAVAALGFLPIANWIPGGHAVSAFQLLLDGWVSGTATCLGIGVVVAILARGRFMSAQSMLRLPADARVGGIDPVSVGIVAAAAVLYVVVARWVFSGRPLLIDEIIQVFQARLFASGRLWLPVPAYPEFTSSMLLIDTGKVYAQFPAGGPAMLALGSLVRAEWLVGPAAGVISAWAFARLLVRIEPRPFVRRLALGLFALAPLVVFMSGTHMNHVTALMWLLLATTALFTAMTDDGTRLLPALGCGLALGMMAAIRPVDAIAFALPAGLWFLFRAARAPGGWYALAAAGAGVAVPMVALGAVNWATTGAPLLLGYSVMWGPSHGLGFHATPWGDLHTPARGLELLNLYFLRLQTYLFETPFPSLLPVIAWLAFGNDHDRADRYFLVSATLLCLLYAAFWHDGFFLGPRYLFPLAPALALFSARAVALPVRHTFVRRALGTALATGLVIALVILLPARVQQHRALLANLRWDPDAGLAQAGVKDAVVLVREGWGSELLARLWALGVSRPAAEHYYGSIDACTLELAISDLEGRGPDSAGVVAVLQRLTSDSSHLVPAAESADRSLRQLPGLAYPPRCQHRLAEDRAGFTVFAPLLLSRRGDVRFIRDLHARDSMLLGDHPGPIYLLKPTGPEQSAPLRFFPVRPDSLWSAWRMIR
jgi:hypothetical protein